MDNSTACAKSKRRKAVCDRGTPSGFPHLRRLPLPINGWPTAIAVLKRGTPRRVAPPPRPEPTAVRHKAARQNQQPRQKALPAGLRPDRRTKRGTCRAWLIDGRGKAWSKRPDRQAGRHGRKRPPLRGAKTGTNHARPTSRPPAQPGACARHARKVRGDRKTEKPVYQEGGRPAPRTKRATAVRRGRKARF